MNILISGVCGFVGSSLARAFRETHPDWELTGIDNFSRRGSWLNREAVVHDLEVRLFHGDIRNQSDVDALPRCDVIIDAAAIPSVIAGIDGVTSSRQIVENNLFGTINLLEYCKRYATQFILLSTSRVYSIEPLLNLAMERVSALPCFDSPPLDGFDRYHPSDRHFPEGLSERGICESFSTAPPVSLYGSTKVASEHMAIEYGEAFDFPVWINRCGVMAGAGQFAQPGQGIFAYWIHSFRQGRPLRYIGFNGQGLQVRDCFHPRDLLPLLDRQIANDKPTQNRVLNVSGGLENSASLAELTAWCANRLTSNDTLSALASSSQDSGRAFDLPWVVLDPSAANQEFDWRPRTTLSSICEEIAAFAERHPAWLEMTTT